MAGNYLVISDLQIPFEHPDALKFCSYIKRHYQISDENVYNVGDELDQYWGGLWDKDPDASHTANQEIQQCISTLEEWYAAFPLMKLCDSNHGTRWKRKALAAQIPSQLMRLYRDIIRAPEGWQWKKQWKVDCKSPFLVTHGDDYGGQYPAVQAMTLSGCSVIMGHHHSKFSLTYSKTHMLDLWAVVTGCLISFDTYAFNYARNAKQKPINGLTVITNQGRIPLLLPQF